MKIPSIIDEKTFEEVQDLVKRKHISHSRKSEYLLTDKLYCGLCGAKMTGNLSKHIYHYYKCVNSKGASKTCIKKKVDRDYIEDLVVKEARNLLTDKNIKIIADKVIEYIEQEKDTSVIKSLKKSIKKSKQELDNLLDSLKHTTSENVKNLILTEIENIQTRQRDLENQLLFEEANNMPITSNEIRFYLTELKKGRINDIKYRRLLIDTFIHKIYLYDDKMIITFTTNSNINVDFPSSNEMLSTFEGAIAPPLRLKVALMRIVYKKKVHSI